MAPRRYLKNGRNHIWSRLNNFEIQYEFSEPFDSAKFDTSYTFFVNVDVILNEKTNKVATVLYMTTSANEQI